MFILFGRIGVPRLPLEREIDATFAEVRNGDGDGLGKYLGNEDAF